MDILMPSLRAVPHLSSPRARGSCKPTDKYPLLHLGGHRGARISGAVASSSVGVVTFEK